MILKLASIFILISSIIFPAKSYSQNKVDLVVQNRLYQIEVNGKSGLINASGEVVVEPIYDFMSGARGNAWKVCIGENSYDYKLLNRKGVLLPADEYDDFSTGYCNQSNFIGAKQADKWGFIDQTGKLVIPCIFDNVQHFQDGYALAELESKKGYIDTSGTFTEIRDYQLSNLSNGFIQTSRLEKGTWYYGLYDAANKTWVLQTEYRSISTVHNGMSIVYVKDKKTDGFGLYDAAGRKWLMHPTFFKQHNAEVVYVELMSGSVKGTNGCDCFCDDELFTTKFHFNDLSVTIGILDKSGTFILNPSKSYTDIGVYNDGYVVAKNGDQQFVLNREGKVLYNTNEMIIGKFSNGLASVSANGKRGFIDTLGKVVIPIQFDDVTEFDQAGIAKVYIGATSDDFLGVFPSKEVLQKRENCTIGYINKLGNYIWEPSH